MNGAPKIIPNDLQLTPKAAINEIPEKKAIWNSTILRFCASAQHSARLQNREHHGEK